jgi:phage-related protein
MELELEPQIDEWLDGLRPALFATVAFHLDRLVESGPSLRMPHSRSLGEGLFELRFDLERQAHRITYFFPGDGRIVLLTVFRKQRMNERAEIERARRAFERCVEEQHTAEGET